MDIWWEYFPVLEIFFSSMKTLFLQNEPPRWMIPEYLLIYLFLVAKVWCTFICFPSATKPGTKSESFWIFQWCVLLFTEGPSILPWPYGFPKKSSDFSIQGSSFTPGIGLHHFPRAPEATVTHGSNGRVKEQEHQQGLHQSHHSKFSHQECQGISRILTQGSWDFSPALKRRSKLQSKAQNSFCVSGRDEDFTLTQQNSIPWTQQMLFCWNSEIPQPPEPFSLYPNPEMLLFYLTHCNIIPCKPHTAHQEYFGCAKRQNLTEQHKEERHKLLSALCCLNSLWSHFPSCRWIIKDFSDSCSPFSTTERSLNDFFWFELLKPKPWGSTWMYSNWNTPWERENQSCAYRRVKKKGIMEVIHQKWYLLPKSGMP